MILTKQKIFEKIEKGKIKIEPFEKELVGPVSIDLRLGYSFKKFSNNNNIIIDKTFDGSKVKYKTIDLKKGEFITIKPRELVLGVTLEKITLARNIGGWLQGRSRFARAGLMIHVSSSLVQPGVSNNQVLEIVNMSPSIMRLYPETAICQITFEELDGNAEYTGCYKNQKRP